MQMGLTPGDAGASSGDVAVEEYAMPTVIESAEGLMPMNEEAQKWADWPKWKDAIKK